MELGEVKEGDCIVGVVKEGGGVVRVGLLVGVFVGEPVVGEIGGRDIWQLYTRCVPPLVCLRFAV